jgi:hypothetical protein
MTFRTCKHAALLTSVVLLMLAAGATTLAAQPAPATGVKNLQRLGGPYQFNSPLKDLAAVKKMAARKPIQKDIGTVLEKAGLASLTPTVVDILTKADPNQIKEIEFQPGDTMVWMAFRRGARPDIVRDLKWGGKKPFPAFSFVIDDMDRTYTFVLPKACANLALQTSEPSREKAKLDAERQEKERVELERANKEKAAAEAARLEAARKERERIEAERAAAAAAAAAAKAETDRKEAARVEADRKEQERVVAEKAKAIGPFADFMFGKERRVRVEKVGGLCAPLFGAKVGYMFQASPNFYIAPSIGEALNFDRNANSSFFAEIEADIRAEKNLFGFGFAVWDVTHGDWISPTVMVHYGRELNQDSHGNKLFFLGEGRLFMNRFDDVKNNYQFWGGIRVILR